MTNVVHLDARRPTKAREESQPVTEFLRELSRDAGELADDWLFQSVSEPTKRAMLAERGIAVAA